VFCCILLAREHFYILLKYEKVVDGFNIAHLYTCTFDVIFASSLTETFCIK